MCSPVVDNRVAPSITAQTSSMKVELGSKVTLSCTATGNPTPSIHWFKDGMPIEGPQAIGNAFVIPEVTPRERGHYQCETFSSYGNPSRSAETEILIQGLKRIYSLYSYYRYIICTYNVNVPRQVLSNSGL